MSGGGNDSAPSHQTTTTRTEIPEFLKPFVERQAEIGVGALEQLPDLLGQGERLTAPLDPLEQRAQAIQLGLAEGFDPSASFGTARDALQSTARGDFLFGGPGFDQAVDAAVRAAQPHIFSTFGGAGMGTGGLAQLSIAEQATDAFAGQFGQERQRQLAAASALPQLDLAELEAFLAPADIFASVGGQRRAQTLQEQLAPITAQETLLQAVGGGVPLGALLGQTQAGQSTQPMFRNRGAGVLGGGALGLGIGAMMAPAGATGIAALGGPLGIGLGLGGAALGGLLS